MRVYINAVEESFGCEIDYAQLHKVYATTQAETRYSPAVCIGCERKTVMGNPDPRSVWGFVQGMTRHSQTLPYADARTAMDKAAGKVMEMAF